MSQTHTLAVHIEHQTPAAYMALPLATRRAVEQALLAQIEARIPKSTQTQWQDPSQLDIQPTTADGVTSFTLDAIQGLLNKIVLELGADMALAATVKASCRYCVPYHCDRVCRDLLIDGAAWVVTAEAVAGDPTTSFSATVGLEFEFPSPA